MKSMKTLHPADATPSATLTLDPYELAIARRGLELYIAVETVGVRDIPTDSPDFTGTREMIDRARLLLGTVSAAEQAAAR